jgi:hypothetical protein
VIGGNGRNQDRRTYFENRQVYGLRRAVVLAGAESQVVSLWKVNDEVTQRLMTAYYRRLVAGEDRAEALRQVQLEMLKDSVVGHPYFWASFIPIGESGPIELTPRTGANMPNPKRSCQNTTYRRC